MKQRLISTRIPHLIPPILVQRVSGVLRRRQNDRLFLLLAGNRTSQIDMSSQGECSGCSATSVMFFRKRDGSRLLKREGKGGSNVIQCRSSDKRECAEMSILFGRNTCRGEEVQALW